MILIIEVFTSKHTAAACIIRHK